MYLPRVSGMKINRGPSANLNPSPQRVTQDSHVERLFVYNKIKKLWVVLLLVIFMTVPLKFLTAYFCAA